MGAGNARDERRETGGHAAAWLGLSRFAVAQRSRNENGPGRLPGAVVWSVF